MNKERWEQLSKEELSRFAPITPDFVVEVKSPSDSLHWLQTKMALYIQNGCRFGWLICPEDETVMLYHADGRVEVVKGFGQKLQAGPVLPGFELDLSLLR